MAAEPPQAEDDELGPRDSAMRNLELCNGRRSKRVKGTLGDSRIALRHLKGIAATIDQLDAERKAPLIHQPSDAVERDVIRLIAHRTSEQLRKLVRRRRHGKAGCVEQAFEQFRAPG